MRHWSESFIVTMLLFGCVGSIFPMLQPWHQIDLDATIKVWQLLLAFGGVWAVIWTLLAISVPAPLKRRIK